MSTTILRERIDALRLRYQSKAIRGQFGATMIALAQGRPDLVAVSADLMYATGMAGFATRYPQRLINVGIPKQNMAGVAAGPAACGKLPVACGYAAFTALRAVEQAKVDCAYNQVKVVLVGMSAGLSYGVGGPTHQSFEDVAIMRTIPNMIVLVPSDAVEVDQALRACAEHPAPTPIYLPLGRAPEHVVNDAGQPFEIGKARKRREGTDLCIFANGSMVFKALIASDAWRESGVHASVLNLHTVKPIDREAILQEAARVKALLLVVVEHSVIGGLGSAVLEVLESAHAFPVERIGIRDAYPPIGPTVELPPSLGLCAEHIALRRLLCCRHSYRTTRDLRSEAALSGAPPRCWQRPTPLLGASA